MARKKKSVNGTFGEEREKLNDILSQWHSKYTRRGLRLTPPSFAELRNTIYDLPNRQRTGMLILVGERQYLQLLKLALNYTVHGDKYDIQAAIIRSIRDRLDEVEYPTPSDVWEGRLAEERKISSKLVDDIRGLEILFDRAMGELSAALERVQSAKDKMTGGGVKAKEIIKKERKRRAEILDSEGGAEG